MNAERFGKVACPPFLCFYETFKTKSRRPATPQDQSCIAMARTPAPRIVPAFKACRAWFASDSANR